MSKKISFKNMFGMDVEKTIYIPDESETIINNILDTYNQIYNYFNINDQDKTTSVLDYISNIMYSDETKLYLGGELNYSKISGDSKAIEGVLEGKDIEENLILIQSLIFNLLFFSVFEYDANKNEVENDELNDEDSIIEYFDEDDDLKGYKFKEDNYFFKLLDIFIGKSWKDQGAVYNKEKNINTTILLTTGYYKDKKDKFHVLFPDRSDIITFIHDCIFNSYRNNNGIIIVNNEFSIDIINDMSFCLRKAIVETLKSIISEKRQNQLERDQLETEIAKTKVAVRSASKDLLRYENVLNYSIELFKSYVERLAEVESTNEKKILEDEHINKALNKIVGIDSSNNFKTNTDIDIFNGSAFISYLSKKIALTAPVELEIDGGKKKNIKNIVDDKEYSLPDYQIDYINDSGENRVFEKEISKFFNGLAKRISDTNLDQSLYFYETVIYGDGYDKSESNLPSNQNSISYYRRKINELCNISGSIISKFILLSLFNLQKTSGYKYNSFSVLQCSSYKLVKKYTTADYGYNQVIVIDNDYYHDYSEAYTALGKIVLKYLKDLIKVAGKKAENKTLIEEVKRARSDFTNYVKSRISDHYFTEKDYFYIKDGNNLRIPSNSFVDIEFRVPNYINDTVEATWIPVTSMRTENIGENNKIVLNENSGYREMHAGTYFDSFELTDNGGVKEIELVLKSVNDINLERIIFNSLSLDSKLISNNNNENISTYVDEMVKNTEYNFRIRFGYRDVAAQDASNNNTAITTSNNSDSDFINRTKPTSDGNVKPVLIYPWTYFKIEGLESNIKDGEDTYTIKGISSGSYALSRMTLCGVPVNFSKDNTDEDSRGTPKNVLGKLIKWITLASTDSSENKKRDISTARICFLGDDEGTIITDFDNVAEEFNSNSYSYELKGGGKLRGGNIETIEDTFYNASNSQLLNAKNFNITNDTKSFSIKEILDGLVDWLPSRVYYIAKHESTNQTVALHVPYKVIYIMDDFFENYPFKTEKITYQIIEADAHIYKNGANFAGDKNDKNYYHKIYFIRMYYEGPGISTTQDGSVPNEYLRIYNYRSLQEQVIESVDISSSNDSEFGNTVSSVMLLGSGTPVVFAYKKEENEQLDGVIYSNLMSVKSSEMMDIKTASESTEQSNRFFDYKQKNDINPKLVFNNSTYVLSDEKGADNFSTISNIYIEEATNFFTAQQNKLYEGELTILGDPFYYFDSSLEAGKYEIYLQMNRVKNMMSYERTDSKYSGIYFITGIKHNMDQTGKYTTILTIKKRVFGSDDGVNADKNKTATQS